MNITKRKYAEQGLCLDCGKNSPDLPHKLCLDCKAKRREYTIKLKERCKKENLCRQCVKETPLPNRNYCSQCIEYRRNASRKIAIEQPNLHKDYRQKVRKEVIAKYGNKCDCCGEQELNFLAIDHKNGDGNQERTNLYGKNVSRTVSWYLKLRREPVRDDLRVLCHNCNIAISLYGSCPHQKGHINEYAHNAPPSKPDL